MKFAALDLEMPLFASPIQDSGAKRSRRKLPFLRSLRTTVMVLFMLVIAGNVITRQTSGADNLWTGAASSNWNTTSANWTSPTIWNNANVDSAIFGATGAGPITLQSSVTARGLRFDANLYTLGGSPLTVLTLAAGGGGSLATGEVRTNFNATIDVRVAGSVGMTKTGTRTLVLTAENAYTGGTTISGGTLQIGNGGTSGSIVGNVTNDSVLAFNRSDDFTFAGIISGTGAVNKVAANTLTLTGFNTYTGVTTISAGTLDIGGGGTTGGHAGNFVNNAVLRFNKSNNITYDGVISGTGSVRKSGPGSLIFTGSNTYTGGTTIESGTLQIGDGSVLSGGSIAGNVLNNGNLTMRLGTFGKTLSGDISGTGSLTKFGSGDLATLFLTGNNTYTGGTTINGGKLQIGDGGTNGSILGNVTNSGELVFNRSDSVSYGGLISGPGRLTKLGARECQCTNGHQRRQRPQLWQEQLLRRQYAYHRLAHRRQLRQSGRQSR